VNVRFHRLFDKASSLDLDAIQRAIYCSVNYESLGDIDFVIENVPEVWETKKAVYDRLDGICPPDCVFAANTSAIPITRIASVTSRPGRVIGMHFMNPVPLSSTVEVVKGFHTHPETVDLTRALLQSMKKECIVVNDSPGFVSNRVLMLMVNESVALVQEQVASVEDVDRLFRNCCGHKMGPLELADLIGLDTIVLSLEVLRDSLGDVKYRPCSLLQKMVDAGLHGRKSGEGFYRYESPATPAPERAAVDSPLRAAPVHGGSGLGHSRSGGNVGVAS